jgi:hypothetical protein
MKTVSENEKCVQGSRSRSFLFATVGRGVASIASRASAFLAILLVAGVAGSPAKAGFNITVPNGDFSQTGNDGSVGGGLLTGSATRVIGTGPWSGTYNGIAGVIAPPSLTINPGVATISGVAGINALGLGLVNSSGDFSETLTGVSYLSNATYTLSATVDVGQLVSLSALNSAGVGIGLTSNGSLLSAANGGSTPTVAISLLSGTSYEVTSTYTTSSTAPLGSIGLELYDDPTNLATVNLFQFVSFSSVGLTASVPEPSSVAMMSVGLFLAGGFGVLRNRKKRSLVQANLVS